MSSSLPCPLVKMTIFSKCNQKGNWARTSFLRKNKKNMRNTTWLLCYWYCFKQFSPMKIEPSNEAPSYVKKPVQVKGNTAWYSVCCVALQHCTRGVWLFAIRWCWVDSQSARQCKMVTIIRFGLVWYGKLNIYTILYYTILYIPCHTWL